MFGYNAYCADQGSQNCCWLYAPAIARAALPTAANFQLELANLKASLLLAGYTQAQIDGMIQNGAPPQELPRLTEAMGMEKVASLKELCDKNGDQNAIYWALESILKKKGPVVLQHAALGSGSIHQSALIGVMTAILEDAEQEASEEIEPAMIGTYLITAHTQHLGYTAMLADMLVKHSNDATIPVPTDIYSVKRSTDPLSVIELKPILDPFSGSALDFKETVPLSIGSICDIF